MPNENTIEHRMIGNDGAMVALITRYDPFAHREVFTVSPIAV